MMMALICLYQLKRRNANMEVKCQTFKTIDELNLWLQDKEDVDILTICYNDKKEIDLFHRKPAKSNCIVINNVIYDIFDDGKCTKPCEECALKGTCGDDDEVLVCRAFGHSSTSYFVARK